MRTVGEIGEEAEARLEELQTETGKPVTQQQLLSQLIEDAYQSREDVVNWFRGETVPLTDEEKEAMQRGRFSSGVETEEGETDDKLYDSSPE